MSNHREDFPIVQMLLQALPVERLCYNSSWVIQMTSDDLKWPFDLEGSGSIRIK